MGGIDTKSVGTMNFEELRNLSTRDNNALPQSFVIGTSVMEAHALAVGGHP